MGERLKITLVLLALVALIGAGCGGDDDTTSSGSGSASSGSASESDGSASESSGSESGSGDSESSSGDSESSSGESADGGGATLTKAEFVTQGNQICLETREEIGSEIEAYLDENTKSSGDGAGLKEAREIAEDIVVPHFKTQNEELRELAIPAGEEAEVEAIFDRLESETDAADADAGVLLGASVSPFLAARKLASKYGLNKCGRI